MARLILSSVEAQLVRLAQAASGLSEARERFFGLVAPVLEGHGVTEGTFDEVDGVLALVTADVAAVEPDALPAGALAAACARYAPVPPGLPDKWASCTCPAHTMCAECAAARGESPV